MKKRLIVLLFVLLPTLVLADDALQQKPSKHSVQETMDRLQGLVTEKGMTVFARIDHRQNAVAIGKNLGEAQLLIFGNPGLGTRIMANDIRAGLDLPLRVLVYADPMGQTQILYHDPKTMQQHFDLGECISLEKAQNALGMLTSKAAEQ